MTLAELMALLEAMENGEDMKACIKEELDKLRKESAKHCVEKTKAEEESNDSDSEEDKLVRKRRTVTKDE